MKERKKKRKETKGENRSKKGKRKLKRKEKKKVPDIQEEGRGNPVFEIEQQNTFSFHTLTRSFSYQSPSKVIKF